MAANVFHYFSYIINMKLALLVCPVSLIRTVLLIPIALIDIRESKLFLFKWRGFLVKAESF